ncbi:MAG: hypothetical protein ACHQDD_03300 [Steroidobacterales bacterium]
MQPELTGAERGRPAYLENDIEIDQLITRTRRAGAAGPGFDRMAQRACARSRTVD